LYPICDSSSSFPNTVGWRNTSSRNQMRRWPSRVGIARGNHGISPVVELLKGLDCESRSRGCLVLCGLGVRVRARPRPGALGTWRRPVLPPPKFPGARGGYGILPSTASPHAARCARAVMQRACTYKTPMQYITCTTYYITTWHLGSWRKPPRPTSHKPTYH
jgi:hypothetical protein